MTGYIDSDIEIEKLSITVNEEDDEEQDIFLKNAEFWIDMIVDETMAELLGRTEALRRKI